jgi:transposase
LSALVQIQLEQTPFSGQVFVFRGRRGDLIKLLWFDGDGLCNPSTESPQYRV